MPELNSVLYGIIGHRISELRKFNNDNQQQLAIKIGIGRSSISNFEAGRQPISLTLLYRIAQVYNTEVHVLLPHVSEVSSKTSLVIEKVNETLEDAKLNEATKSYILGIINKSEK